MDSAAPVEAFPWETVPKYWLRDRDAVYGAQYQHRVTNLGIDPGLTAVVRNYLVQPSNLLFTQPLF